MKLSIKAAAVALAVTFTALAPTAVYAIPTPTAMKLFCQGNPDECRPGGASRVRVSDALVKTLQTVNSRVNKSIRYQAERADIWKLNPKAGDCEDYVLSKRSALIQAGVPGGALRIAFTYTRRGVPHAVLIVRTNQGDLVLDNMNNSVLTLAQSGYNIRMMSGSDPMRWTAG